MVTLVPRPSMNMNLVDENGRMTREAQRFFIQLWERTGGANDDVGGSLQASNNLSDLDDDEVAVSNLGFSAPILDKRSPGAIGSIAPSSGAFTTVIGTTITSSVQINLPNYTVATLPSAATNGGWIFVTDETGGAIPAFSDTSDWRRCTDRAVVS